MYNCYFNVNRTEELTGIKQARHYFLFHSTSCTNILAGALQTKGHHATFTHTFYRGGGGGGILIEIRNKFFDLIG